MNFSENLQTLRKSRGISQEQLAERLDVSRQAVSKWETDGGYPEMDKLIQLCDIFGVTMDELIKGQIEIDKTDVRLKHEKNFNGLAKGIATGVFLIIFGVAMTTLFAYFGLDEVGTAIMFIFIAAAIALFVVFGMRNESYTRANPVLPEIYTPEECERYNTRVFPYFIAGGIALIFLGILLTTVSGMSYISWLPSEAATSIMLALIAAAVWMFIYAGIMRSKYDVKDYNRERDFEQGIKDTDPPEVVREKKLARLRGIICGTVMLTATAVFLFIGMVFDIWEPTYVVFPIGGIICCIVVMLTKTKG